MRIVFQRAGGFAGLVRSASLDWDDLAADDRRHLSQLIEEAGFFDLPTDIGGDRSVPDDFTYLVEIETGGKTWRVTTTDHAAPERLRPLLEWLDRAARPGGL